MIDDAEKRRTAAGVAAHPLGPAVTPTAQPDVEWRAQAAWGFIKYPIRFTIASQQPLFVPVWGIVQHSSESAEFVSAGD